MLEVLRAKVGERGLANVDFVQAGFLTYEHAGDPADVVYDFAPEEAEHRLEAWCATGGDGVVGEWSRAELEEHARDEHSTFTWLLEPMIRPAGFDIEDAEHSEDGIFARYVLRAAWPGAGAAGPVRPGGAGRRRRL